MLEAFLKDTHYRNQFETNISAGTLGTKRDGWERQLFAGGYHQGKGATPWERPEYGALNLYQHPRGSAALEYYGSCVFELCSDVRRRATFSWGDSSGTSTDTPATCEHFAHVLSRFPDYDIQKLVAGTFLTAAEEIRFLVETQIHGPVEFWCDVKELRYSSTEPAETRKRLETLAENNAFPTTVF